MLVSCALLVNGNVKNWLKISHDLGSDLVIAANTDLTMKLIEDKLMFLFLDKLFKKYLCFFYFFTVNV